MAIDGYDPLHKDGGHDVDALLDADESLLAASPVARPPPQSHTLNPEAEMWALHDAARREMLGEDAKGIATHTQPRLIGDTVRERHAQGTASTGGVKPIAHVKPLATQPATADSRRAAKNNRFGRRLCYPVTKNNDWLCLVAISPSA